MSAKWRRIRKDSRKFSFFKSTRGVKRRDSRQTFRIEDVKSSRQIRRYEHGAAKSFSKRKMSEPEPLIDILEEADEIVVIAEFAGFKREHLETIVRNQRLTLSAKTADRKYYKSLNLPRRVIPSNVFTTYKNGVLEIRLKKAVEEKAMDKVAG